MSIPVEKVKDWIETSKKIDSSLESWPPLFAEMIHSSRIMSKLQRSIPFWLRELTADILAARFFGVGFYLVARELFNLISTPIDSPYPPNWKRLVEIARETTEIQDEWEKNIKDRIESNFSKQEKNLIDRIQKMMKLDLEFNETPIVNITSTTSSSSKLTPDKAKELLDKTTLSIIEESIVPAMTIIKEKVREKIPLKDCFCLSDDIFLAASYLRSYIPPTEKLGNQPAEQPPIFDIRMILSAVWLRWLDVIDEMSINKDNRQEYNSIMNLYYIVLLKLKMDILV